MKGLPSINRHSLLLLGFSSLTVQLALLREVVVITHSNELSIGLLLAVWMIATGLGSRISIGQKRFKTINWIVIFHVLLAIFTLLTKPLAFLLFNLFTHSGEMAGPIGILVIISAILPICIVSGVLFGANVAGDGKSVRAYLLDTLGSAVAGIAFGLLIIIFSSVDMILLIISGLNIMFVFPKVIHIRKSGPWITLVLSVLLLVACTLAVINQDKIRIFTSYYADSLHGRIEKRCFKECMIYYNGAPLLGRRSIQTIENMVHLPLIQRNQYKKICVIGGINIETITEINKHKPNSIDALEQDPELLDIVIRDKSRDNLENCSLIADSPINYLNNCEKKYDAILINIPIGYSAGSGRFYTREFYEMARQNLEPGALLATQLQVSANYLSDSEVDLVASVINAIKSSFDNLALVHSGGLYIIASDSAVSNAIGTLSRRYDFDYVNSGYFDDMDMRLRSDQLLKQIEGKDIVNTELQPVSYYLLLNNYLAAYGIEAEYIFGVLSIVFGLLYIIQRRGARRIFSFGFALSALQFIILIYFQSAYGNMFAVMGLLIVASMLGLALGSSRIVDWKRFRYSLILPLFILICALQYLLMLSGPGQWVTLLLSLLVLTSGGIITGRVYRLVDSSVNTANTYSADLYGAAAGSLLMSVLVVPVAGLDKSLMVIVAIIVLGMLPVGRE